MLSPIAFPDFDSCTSMMFIYPQMPFSWQYTMPYQSINPFELQIQQMAALQYNATLMQSGNRTFVIPRVPPLIPQLGQCQELSAGHQDCAHQPEQGPHKTAASNHLLHASFGTITDDNRTILHHRRVGDANNARSSSAGRPPSLGMSAMPNHGHRSRSRIALQNRSKRASATRGQRKCDDLLQYVVASEGTERMSDSNFHPLSTNSFFQPDKLGRDAEGIVSRQSASSSPRHRHQPSSG